MGGSPPTCRAKAQSSELRSAAPGLSLGGPRRAWTLSPGACLLAGNPGDWKIPGLPMVRA